MQKHYKLLIFDADHTLLDYLADERAAFVALYDELSYPQTDELLAFSRYASESTWTEAGMYDVHDKNVQQNYHRVYREHVTGIFEKIFAKFGAPETKLSAQTAGEKFLQYLERKGALFSGARETLVALSKRYKICIATNGISPIQRGRLSELKPFVAELYISEEVGAIKPLPAYFQKICREQGVLPSECLMIGDSLSSDVAGAKAVGMDSCWYNPRSEKNSTPFTPNFEIKTLQELQTLL
ncbi:MAG: HAD family hydrolase [Clostridia bacterium]|nr:HAD family hydrolase [Clostridia bacterium]